MEVGSYGNITFEITKENFLTIKSMTREKKSKWEEHSVLNDLSFLEFRGRELNTITFDMQLIDSLGSDISGTLTKLNNILEDGENHYLSIGGNTIGEFPFILEGISEVFNKYYNGFRYVEVTVTLREYRDNTKSLRQLREERSAKNQVQQMSEGEIIDSQGSVRDV